MEYTTDFQKKLLKVLEDTNPKAYKAFVSLPMEIVLDQLQSWEEQYDTVEDAKEAIVAFAKILTE